MIAQPIVYRDPDSRDVHVWPLQKLSKKTCLVCCQGGNVLSCGGGNCLIVVHQSCMPCAARFGNNGEFCCPYCFYKHSHTACHQAKEKFLLARKALSNFLDVKVDSGQQDECTKLPTCGEEQEEARLPTSSRCCAEGTVSKEAENLNENPQETLKMFKPHLSGRLHKKHTEIELRGASANLTSNPKRKDMNDEPNKGSKGRRGDDIFVTSQTAMTSKNTEHPAETAHRRGRTEGGKSREKSPKHATHPMKTDSAFVTLDKLGNLEQQENATVVAEYNCGGAQKKHNQALRKKISCSLSKEDNKMERHKESNRGINSLGGNQMAVDPNADEPVEKRGGPMKRTHKVRRKVILPEKDAHPMRDTVSVTNGESDSASSRHSCNTGTLKNGITHKKLLENSEFEFSELEDHEVVTSGRQIVRSTKWNKHPTLPKKKRTPLRWSAEEVDMLKEGVRKFSLTVNKNMPWRKILEYGRHVFDGTREPEDLREKWKKLSKRY